MEGPRDLEAAFSLGSKCSIASRKVCLVCPRQTRQRPIGQRKATILTRRYRIGSVVVEDDHPAALDILADAYARKIRPFCLCQSAGIPMYIARIGEEPIVKRMPLTGSDHHVACPSYEAPYELSGLGPLIGNAIQIDAADGTAALKLDFSLTKRGPRAPLADIRASEGPVKNEARKLSLRGVLHYLWHQAGLTEWTAHWAGKRHWFQVHAHLADAAREMSVKGRGLAERLYVPETFRAADKPDIERRRAQALSALRPASNGVRDLMLLIGEVKDFATARSGQKIVVKHMPGYPLFLEDTTLRRLQARYARELELWKAEVGSHLILIATFGLSASGLIVAEDVSLMCTSEQWIPIENIHEQRLVERLARLSQKSVKGLRFNLPSTKPIAAAALPHRRQGPVALYIVPPDADEAFEAALSDMIAARPDIEPWIWRVVEGDIPDLPVL